MSITAYTTPATLLAEFGERELVMLTDVGTPPTGAVDDAVAQRACDRANAEVTAALAARYPLPLPAVPEALRYLAADLAHYHLYQVDAPDWVKDRFTRATEMLRDIQTGKAALGADATGAVAAAQTSDQPEFNTGAKVWGREAAW